MNSVVRLACCFAAVFLLRVDTALCNNTPSFDCRRAGSPTELAVCGNAELARLDRQLARLWREFVGSYNDERQVVELRADQKQWLATRNLCGGDAECVRMSYVGRLKRLTGEDPSTPASGMFDAKGIGRIALYPLGTQYVVSIQTAKPTSGAWTCDVAGRATVAGSAVRVTVGNLSFTAQLRDPKTIVIGAGPDVAAVSAESCGLNGTIAFAYTRSPAAPN